MKNYYQILGVLDDAEDIIIRAAYKALAQRYHPDKWTGNKEAATQKMCEINEAYEILSNLSSRKKYDNEFFEFNSRGDYEDFEDNLSDDIEDEINHDWKIASEFYPNIVKEHSELYSISAILANTFKSFLIETKQFNKSTEIKIKYEEDYLLKFYGSDKLIQNYAKFLLLNSHKKAAIKLNKIIRVLGQSSKFDSVRAKINTEFPEILKTLKNTKLVHNSSFKRFANNSLEASTNDAIFIIEMWFDTKVRTKQGFFSDQYSFDVPNSSLSYHEIDTDTIRSMAYEIVRDLKIFYPT
jgi:curved DNA-binding protein CbpA